jgi:hypothetical protein
MTFPRVVVGGCVVFGTNWRLGLGTQSLRRASSLKSLQARNAEWAARLQGKSVNPSDFKLIRPDGDNLHLSATTRDGWRPTGYRTARQTDQLAPDKTVGDVCEALNV